MSTYGMAGIPMLIRDNTGHRVGSQEYLEKQGMALKYNSIATIKDSFTDRDKVNLIRENVWNNRNIFSFDYHIQDLIDFFYKVIHSKNSI